MTITEYEHYLVNNIISDIITNKGDKYLSSIVLTGSIGRGEGTYKIHANGQFELISDIEVALIVKNPIYSCKIKRLIAKVLENYTEELNMMVITASRIQKNQNYNYSFITPEYRTLFMYDLHNGSKTIWGKDVISGTSINIYEVDEYEAKRIVANRIGELLYHCEYTGNSEEDLQLDRIFWKGKVLLAIGSAWLISEKIYSTSYHSQYELLKKYAYRVNQLFGQEFLDDYEKTFLYLRDRGTVFDVNDTHLRYYVKIIDTYFKLRNYHKSKINSLSKKINYFSKYMKTGLKFGLFNYEDKIFQTLISGYGDNMSSMSEIAETWKKVFC